jgi:hypothetical protein
MVVVHRESGFRFVIYKDDHEPAHVHVWGSGESIVTLSGADGKPELRRNIGASKADIRRILRIVAHEQLRLLARWQEIHDGTD